MVSVRKLEVHVKSLFIRIIIVVVIGLSCLFIAQQLGWMPLLHRGSLYKFESELIETRILLEAMREYSGAQVNISASTECVSKLVEAEKRLAACEGGWASLNATRDGGDGISDLISKMENCTTQKDAARFVASHIADADDLQGMELVDQVAKLKVDIKMLQVKHRELYEAYSKVMAEKAKLDTMPIFESRIADSLLSEDSMRGAREAIEKCGRAAGPVTLSLDSDVGRNCSSPGSSGRAYFCRATDEDLRKYLTYEPRQPCPDDWFFVQELIFVKNCFCLPKRRCLARTPQASVRPIPFPQSLFDQRALANENVRWGQHHCKDFECLNTRVMGDCRNCFNMSLESRRWRNEFRGAIRMADVIAMKGGSLRIGLDAGGGSGSFAAHMATYNVTILTTAMNVETLYGIMQGLPYMETIALRGLIPLHLPHKARLPFFDNTLDVIHSVNSIKYLELLEFEELVMEWDRVLRPGGIMWFEMFYTPIEEMPLYVAILDQLKYKHLYWNLTPKLDAAEHSKKEHVYLNCVLEKIYRQD